LEKNIILKKVLEKNYFEKKYWKKNYFEKVLGKNYFENKVLEIRPDSVINTQNFRISLSGAAFLLFCRVLARPAKKKLGGKAFNVRVCREAVADRFPGIPGSLVETSVPENLGLWADSLLSSPHSTVRLNLLED